MKTSTHSFSLSNLSDKELLTLASSIREERGRRERKRKEARQKWIDGYYFAYLNNPNATVVHVGETTVLALWSHALGVRMGTATPVHGDVFDHNTGIAVAYAKAVGDEVPDYI